MPFFDNPEARTDRCPPADQATRRQRSQTGASHARIQPLGTTSIPRRIRRGLIEAYPVSIISINNAVIPRRIRRGLIEASWSSTGQPDGSSHSPANSPGASLKRVMTWEMLIALFGAFPGEFAGASLKLSVFSARARGVYGIPRRIRRGLIEARGSSGRRFATSWPFPGEFAGASLKPPDAEPVLLTLDTSFPGEFAGASLKPGCQQGRLDPLSPFPGEFAGASLKLGWIVVLSCVMVSIPRRIRRGLIEAKRRKAFASCGSGTHSPANSPGPSLKRVVNLDGLLGGDSPIPRRIRRGLIEASRFPRVRPRWAWPFPGEFAGASLKLRPPITGTIINQDHSPANSPGPH